MSGKRNEAETAVLVNNCVQTMIYRSELIINYQTLAFEILSHSDSDYHFKYEVNRSITLESMCTLLANIE